jgi:hypothetical protein
LVDVVASAANGRSLARLAASRFYGVAAFSGTAVNVTAAAAFFTTDVCVARRRDVL